MATSVPIDQMEIVLMVWEQPEDGLGQFVERDKKIGFYPSISLFELNAKGLEITDVNCYPVLRRTVVFAHKKETV